MRDEGSARGEGSQAVDSPQGLKPVPSIALLIGCDRKKLPEFVVSLGNDEAVAMDGPPSFARIMHSEKQILREAYPRTLARGPQACVASG